MKLISAILDLPTCFFSKWWQQSLFWHLLSFLLDPFVSYNIDSPSFSAFSHVFRISQIGSNMCEWLTNGEKERRFNHECYASLILPSFQWVQAHKHTDVHTQPEAVSEVAVLHPAFVSRLLLLLLFFIFPHEYTFHVLKFYQVKETECIPNVWLLFLVRF